METWIYRKLEFVEICMEPSSYSKKSGNAPEYTHLENIEREEDSIFQPTLK